MGQDEDEDGEDWALPKGTTIVVSEYLWLALDSLALVAHR